MDWETKQPDSKEVNVLEAILSYKGDFREQFIRAVFEYYNDDVYEAFTQVDEQGNDITHLVAPKIAVPEQIWPMLWEPRLSVRSSKLKHTISFGMSFECRWDREHGLGVQYDDWQITYIGGASDV